MLTLSPAEADAFKARFRVWCNDPLTFVREVFPWGMAGTSLADKPGPYEWQAEELAAIRDALAAGTSGVVIRRAVSSGHGVGKALAWNELVLTPRGWRPIGTLKAGDEVISVDGEATLVTGVYPQGVRPMFRVTLDDGCSVRADGEHLWLTDTRGERKHGKPGSIRTTAEIAESLTFPNGPARGLNHRLPTVSAVKHQHRDLPLDPYVLGAWLGDGDAKGRIVVDDDITPLLEAAGAEFGARTARRGTHVSTRTLLGARPALRALGLFGKRSHEKSVPLLYMHASIPQRIALLQGLLDTDGTCQRNGAVVFEVTSSDLADNVCELTRSLGGVARRSERVGQYGDVICRRVYRCYLSLPAGVPPFRLQRKASRYAPNWQHKNRGRVTGRFIESVTPDGEDEAVCITVAHPSKLFVTRDHIVTHNSALVSWLILWAMLYPDCRGVTTANTEKQLTTKTWAELAKWHSLLMPELAAQFRVTATAIMSTNDGEEKTWRIDAIAWSETNTEAFAGLHNEGKRIIALFDEASAIADKIWEVTEGALTDSNTQILWLVYGNPTRPVGRFADTWGRFRERWAFRAVDSRTVPGTNKAQIAEWEHDYGVDSDFFKVRVRGLPPAASATSFISATEVSQAMAREPHSWPDDPLIMAIDVARGGDDEVVISFRRGMDARGMPWVVIPGSEARDSMRLIAKVTDLATTDDRFRRPDAIMVDETGVGGPIVDRLRQVLGDLCPVYGVNFAGKSPDEKHANMRMTLYWRLREAMRAGLAIPNDPILARELTAIEYQHDRSDRMLLMPKDRMKADLGFSPDRSDSLAVSFAFKVQKRTHTAARGNTPHMIRKDVDPRE